MCDPLQKRRTSDALGLELGLGLGLGLGLELGLGLGLELGLEPLYAAHARDERREEEPGQQYARAARALEPRLLGLRACTLYYLPLLGWTTLL